MPTKLQNKNLNKLTADEAYKQSRQKITAKIIKLTLQLGAMDKEQKFNKDNWNYTGNLGYINQKLDELLEAFSD